MPHTLRICTWNIQLGARLDKILALVKQQADFVGLDLLALQEASAHAHHTDGHTIAAALGPQYDYFQVTAHMLRGQAQANALIWNTERVRVTGRHSVTLPQLYDVVLPRAERALLRALPRQTRNCLVVEGALAHHALRVYVAHLDVVGFQHKREQFAHVLADARAREVVDLTVVAGDLNTFRIRRRPTWAGLSAAANANGFQDLTVEVLWTQAVRRLRLRQKLDAIFARARQPLRYHAWGLDVQGSDHIPVFADIALD